MNRCLQNNKAFSTSRSHFSRVVFDTLSTASRRRFSLSITDFPFDCQKCFSLWTVRFAFGFSRQHFFNLLFNEILIEFLGWIERNNQSSDHSFGFMCQWKWIHEVERWKVKSEKRKRKKVIKFSQRTEKFWWKAGQRNVKVFDGIFHEISAALERLLIWVC